MHPISWRPLAAILIVAHLPATAQDFTTLPPSPDVAEKRVKDSRISLIQAIEIAQESAGGVAASAQLDVSGATREIKVLVYGQGKATEVLLDAASGEIKKSTEIRSLPGEPKRGELKKTASGLQYYDLVVGDGEQPNGPSTKVKVHYTGYLVTGKKFDSSKDRGQPIDFPLNGVIKGWTEGVGSMKVGGKRKLIIPFDLAYGARGRPPVIPAKATLIFDVELLEIVN